MTDKEIENIKKLGEISGLISDPATDFPPEFLRFFDFESDKMLDEKIKVLTEMRGGKSYADIPNFYDILELWPDHNTHWN